MKNEYLNFIKIIEDNIGKDQDTEINEVNNNIPYEIRIVSSSTLYGVNIPFIVAYPKIETINYEIMLEANNKEGNNQEILLQAGNTLLKLMQITRDNPCPLIVPIIPSKEDAPYYQQLSRECFKLDKSDKLYRLDEQIVGMINYTKDEIKLKYGKEANHKIFLNGYSSSGVFAQRFSLIHPELIDIMCIGGASGSIPLPTAKLSYPLGIDDYEQLFNRKFDHESFKKIKFRYYVGELEEERKTNERYQEDNLEAPMHDMSYYDRSVPRDVGQKQRDLFGKGMIERSKKIIGLLQEDDFDIDYIIIKGRGHNNYKNIIGVNNIGELYINNVYNHNLEKKSITK